VNTRREFVMQTGAGLALSLVAPVGYRLSPTTPRQTAIAAMPVVSILLDQPYLDLTGRELPYRPPPGLRSAQPLAELDEQAFRSVFCWI